ncbi:MAG: deoxyribodipyrimidine photo-lyase [Candidatus Limnocylindrales bacterium]
MTLYKVGPWRRSIVWFRRDLRLADHPALSEAVAGAQTVLPLFVLDERLLTTAAPARAWFLRGSMAELDRSLRERGSGLLVHAGDPASIVPRVAREVDAEVVLASADVTPFARGRDAAVAAALEADGRRLLLREGVTLVDPGDVRTGAGAPYTVFTPFWRKLQAVPRRAILPTPAAVATPPELLRESALPVTDPSPHPDLPSPGEAAARERLERWVAGGVASYPSGRERLDGSGSSHLGADLHFGTLSPLQVESAAGAADADAEAFTRQLAWRELYHHHLHHQATKPRPVSALTRAFRRESDDPDAVAAWRDGRTGIPTVDAAMRQLATTGWMSNRARLVTASFLTRHLLMDWRIGERHFLAHLVDGDVANNRGGWEWSAGVGLDAQPWFRILNPVRQGQRFDADGAWVRRWIPELEFVPNRYVHAPWEFPHPVPGYPAPIVDLAEGRSRALAAFKAATAR